MEAQCSVCVLGGKQRTRDIDSWSAGWNIVGYSRCYSICLAHHDEGQLQHDDRRRRARGNDTYLEQYGTDCGWRHQHYGSRRSDYLRSKLDASKESAHEWDLLLSACKAKGIPIFPSCIYRAIENTAKQMNGLSTLQQGWGMIQFQFEKAWEYLLARN
jgi:hypothetical protein